MDRLAEVLPNIEEYQEALRADLGDRRPRTDTGVLDHLLGMEALLVKSILAGFSYGCGKA